MITREPIRFLPEMAHIEGKGFILKDEDEGRAYLEFEGELILSVSLTRPLVFERHCDFQPAGHIQHYINNFCTYMGITLRSADLFYLTTRAILDIPVSPIPHPGHRYKIRLTKKGG